MGDQLERAVPRLSWADRALAIVERLAQTRPEFTTDDVWSLLEAHYGDRRGLGAVMIRARKAGWIVATGRYIKSDRAECNRRPVLVWRSCFVRGPDA